MFGVDEEIITSIKILESEKWLSFNNIFRAVKKENIWTKRNGKQYVRKKIQ